jgi:hypothetical protein
MRTRILSAFLLLPFLFALNTSCKKDNKEGGGGDGGGGGSKPSIECINTGKIVSVPCGTGVFNNLWIMDDKGNYFQPCEMFPTLVAVTVKEGDAVKFGYQAVTNSPACDSKLGCALATPKATRIKITCLNVTTTPSNGVLTTEGTIRNSTIAGCGYVIALNTNMAPYEVLKWPAGFVPQADKKIKFSFRMMNTATKCMVGPVVEVLSASYITTPAPTTCKPISITNSNPGTAAGVSIKKVARDGNCLKIGVGYSGCASNKDKFTLDWNGNRMESLPVKVGVSLGNLPPGPTTCAAYFEETLSFDLTKLKTSPNEKIVISLSGWSAPIEY